MQPGYGMKSSLTLSGLSKNSKHDKPSIENFISNDKSVQVYSDKAFIPSKVPRNKASPIEKRTISGSDLLINIDEMYPIGKSILIQSLNNVSLDDISDNILNQSQVLRALNNLS